MRKDRTEARRGRGVSAATSLRHTTGDGRHITLTQITIPPQSHEVTDCPTAALVHYVMPVPQPNWQSHIPRMFRPPGLTSPLSHVLCPLVCPT